MRLEWSLDPFLEPGQPITVASLLLIRIPQRTLYEPQLLSTSSSRQQVRAPSSLKAASHVRRRSAPLYVGCAPQAQWRAGRRTIFKMLESLELQLHPQVSHYMCS